MVAGSAIHVALLVLEVITLVQLTLALWVYVHIRAAWTTFYFLSVSLVVMVSQMF